MKKLLGFIVAIALTVSSLSGFFIESVVAKAHTLDAADEYFTEFVLSDSTFNGRLSYTHSPLYDEQLNEHGREYIFTIGNVNGYALMVEYKTQTQTFYEIEELFYNASSPFSNCQGLPVYLAHNTYIEYKDQAFFDIETDAQVSAEIVAELAEEGFNYFGGTTATFTDTTFTVEYARKTTQQYTIPLELPNIIGSVQGGCCAHTAGLVLLTYYDRFCENIMPNYDPMIRVGSIVRYRTSSEEMENVGYQLVDMMLIGEPHEGVTFSEFQLGMETFVEQQGYTYTTTNLFTNGSFNFNSYKTAVESGKPCALFLTNFTMSNGIAEGDGQDTIGRGYCPVSHVAAGCGYKIDTYYDANNNIISTHTYLLVASGLIRYNIGYLSLSGTTISKAISVLVS